MGRPGVDRGSLCLDNVRVRRVGSVDLGGGGISVPVPLAQWFSPLFNPGQELEINFAVFVVAS